MIIVTGSTGLTGSNIVEALNDKGITDILVVSNLKDGIKFINLVDLDIADYVDKEDFLIQIMAGEELGDAEAIFHEGVYSFTTERDGKYMMDNNHQYSKELLYYCLKRETPFLYAFSIVAYGGYTSDSIEFREYEKPLNAYSYSEPLSDEYVHQILPEVNSQIVGSRHFNACGSHEGHKSSMVSVAFYLNTQFNSDESSKLFGDNGNFKRDLVYAGDVIDVNLWLLGNGVSGIFNPGTGRAESFQAVADAMSVYHKKDQTEYIPFLGKLKDRHQVFVQVDLTSLCAAGYDKPFKAAVEGVTEYMAWLNRDA